MSNELCLLSSQVMLPRLSIIILTLLIVNSLYAQITEVQMNKVRRTKSETMKQAFIRIDSVMQITPQTDTIYDALILFHMLYGSKLNYLKKVNTSFDNTMDVYEKTGTFLGEKVQPIAISNMLNRKALNLQMMGNFTESESVFLHAISICSYNKILYTNLAKTLILNSKYQEALDVLALDKSSETLENVSYLKASAYYNLREIDSASFYINKYQKTEQSVDDYMGYLLQGKIAIRLKNYEAACDAFYLAQQNLKALYAKHIAEDKNQEDLAFWLNHLDDKRMDIEMQIHLYCP